MLDMYTVTRFVSISAKFDICTVVGLNGTIAEIRTWGTLCACFSFNKCSI